MKSWLPLTIVLMLVSPVFAAAAGPADGGLTETVVTVNARLRPVMPARFKGYAAAAVAALVTARYIRSIPAATAFAMVTSTVGTGLAGYEVLRYVHNPRYHLTLAPEQAALLKMSVADQVEAAYSNVVIADFYRHVRAAMDEQINARPAIEFETHASR